MSIKDEIIVLCLRHRVRDLYLFGSRAHEISAIVHGQSLSEKHGSSDIDVGIFPQDIQDWSPRQKVNFTIELEDLLQAGQIDLVLLPEADPFLALDIIRGELVYTADPDQQARYELYVLRRAEDLLPFKKAKIRMLLGDEAL